MLQVETPTKPRKTMMEKTFVIFIVVPLVAFLTCLNATIAVIRSDGRTNKRRRTNIFTIRNNVWEGTSRCFIPSHKKCSNGFFWQTGGVYSEKFLVLSVIFVVFPASGKSKLRQVAQP